MLWGEGWTIFYIDLPIEGGFVKEYLNSGLLTGPYRNSLRESAAFFSDICNKLDVPVFSDEDEKGSRQPFHWSDSCQVKKNSLVATILYKNYVEKCLVLR